MGLVVQWWISSHHWTTGGAPRIYICRDKACPKDQQQGNVEPLKHWLLLILWLISEHLHINSCDWGVRKKTHICSGSLLQIKGQSTLSSFLTSSPASAYAHYVCGERQLWGSAFRKTFVQPSPLAQRRAFRMAELWYYHCCAIRQQGEEALAEAVMVSLRCRCTLCLFAFAEVNGLGECVLNKNAQERETSKEGGRERKKITRREPPSLDITC